MWRENLKEHPETAKYDWAKEINKKKG